MEFLAKIGFSDIQNVILLCRVNGDTYRKIREVVEDKYHRTLPDSDIVTVLVRSALGYRWELDMNGGQHSLGLLQ